MKKIILLKNHFFHLMILFISLIVLYSCATPDCPTCQDKERKEAAKPPYWNIALKNEIYDQCEKKQTRSIVTDIKPDSIPTADGISSNITVIGLPCADGKSNIYEIPYSYILEITTVSNPLIPPEYWKPDTCICCPRVRDGLWIFDKFEIRGMLGYRGKQKSISYPQKDGTYEIYEPSFIGFERGGSDMVLGIELAAMWSVKFIDPSERFQIGILTGLWPFDGSTFVPVSIHPRYTFNQKPNPYSNDCNSWYVFGDVGIPLDFQTEAPVFGEFFDRQRYFVGIGLGHDWWISRGADFSVDLGVRLVNVPLPPFTCCPDVPKEDTYPYRKSVIGFLRFGFTF